MLPRRGLLVLLALALTGGGLHAAPSDPARLQLLAKMWNVTGADYFCFDARDHLGGAMEGVKIIANPEGKKADHDLFVAIYHNDSHPVYGNGLRRVYLATSDDLQTWKMRSVQGGSSDYPASQATIKAAPQGGFVVAWEQETAAGNSVHVRYYANKDLLYNAIATRMQDCPRQLSLDTQMEGAPTITAITETDVVLDFYQQQKVAGQAAVTRHARGRLSNFFPVSTPCTWQSVPQKLTDDSVLHWLVQWNEAAGASIGDSDGIATYTPRKLGSKVRFSLVEARLEAGNMNASKVFLRDHDSFNADPVWLNVGSTSYGMPSVTTDLKLNGQKITLVSVYIYPEGAVPGQTGQLIYYFKQY